MKVAIFTETYIPTPDGVARQVHLLARELRALGHDALVFTYGGGKRWHYLEDVEGVPTHRFFSVKFPWYPQYRMGRVPVRFINHVVRDADVVHLHTPFFMGTGGFIASKRHDIPSVSTLHTYFIEMKESLNTVMANTLFLRWAWRYNLGLYRRCDIATTPSKRISDIMKSYDFPKPIYIVPNGIDVEPFRKEGGRYDIRAEFSIPPDVPILTYLGRLTRDKGVHNLLRVIRYLKDKGLEVRGLVCGVGLEMDRLKALARTLKIDDRVIFAGYVEEDMKPSIMAQSFLFFLLSKADVQPLTVIEAMSCGTPVVVSDMGGLPELVRHGEVGYVIRYGDIKAVGEAVLRLIKHTEEYKSMRQRAARYARDVWGVRKTAERYVALYTRAADLRTEYKGKG